jgi:uncharacterized Rmd1/YagE family protein
MSATIHRFDAIAFVEDLPPRRVLALYPEAHPRAHGQHLALGGGEVFFYPFGAVVFHGVPREVREGILGRLRATSPPLVADVVREDFVVEEDPSAATAVAGGVLHVDRLTADRAAVVALIVAQSAAMETYERLVDGLFARTGELVGDLERRGTVRLRVRPLHRFIAEAVGTRNEVLSVLHLLDKPDAVWDDPAMDRIYEDLRAEFDLADRYEALAMKLRGVHESLQLVLETARDRRLVLLEAAIVALIVVELVLALLRAS